MSIESLQDQHGNAIRVMTAYEIRGIGGESLLIAIEYLEPAADDAVERKQFQTMVYAQQAFEFAETLKRAAAKIISPDSLDKIQ